MFTDVQEWTKRGGESCEDGLHRDTLAYNSPRIELKTSTGSCVLQYLTTVAF